MTCTCVKMVIDDMIRESGDRGTSILNFLTNFTMFVAASHLMLEEAGLSHKAIDRIIWNSLRTGDLLNILCEGDDGAMGFAQKYVEMITGGDVNLFGTKLVQAYKEFGFNLEPQGPKGEVKPCDALLRANERLEFCSKVFVACGLMTFMYPKPSKFFQSLRVSFNTRENVASAAITKAVSLMAGCLHCPIMYHMCRCLVMYWKDKGGEFDIRHINEYSFGGKELREAAEKYESLQEILEWLDGEHFHSLTPDGVVAVQESFAKETGIVCCRSRSFIGRTSRPRRSGVDQGDRILLHLSQNGHAQAQALNVPHVSAPRHWEKAPPEFASSSPQKMWC